MKPMVDMKYTKAEAKEEYGESMSPEGSNLPDYPYGLTITLDDCCLGKLGIKDLPEIGDEYHVMAVAKVTRLSSSADEKEEEQRMTLQITDLQLMPEAEAKEESTAGENAENKVKSVISNSMY